MLCINQWGFEQGLSVLGKLSKLYSALVWEITLLESASSGEKSPDDCEAIRKDLDRLKVPASGSEGTKLKGECRLLGLNGLLWTFLFASTF